MMKKNKTLDLTFLGQPPINTSLILTQNSKMDLFKDIQATKVLTGSIFISTIKIQRLNN